MVIVEVANIQQVTTQSKTKMFVWEAQEAIWKHTIEWIEKANERNVTELQEQIKPLVESTEFTHGNPT